MGKSHHLTIRTKMIPLRRGVSANQLQMLPTIQHLRPLRRFTSHQSRGPKEIDRRRLFVDDSFFDSINPRVAYAVGLFVTDGSVRGPNRDILEFYQHANCNHLTHQLQTWMRSTYKIGKYQYLSAIFKRGKEYRYINQKSVFRCRSRRLTRLLVEFGKKPQPKGMTSVVLYPSDDHIHPEFQSHFIRGCFDGDGGMCMFGGQLWVKIVGTDDLLCGIQTTVNKCVESAENSGTLYRHKKPLKNGQYYGSLSYGGWGLPLRVLDYVYDECEPDLYHKWKYELYLFVKHLAALNISPSDRQVKWDEFKADQTRRKLDVAKEYYGDSFMMLCECKQYAFRPFKRENDPHANDQLQR